MNTCLPVAMSSELSTPTTQVRGQRLHDGGFWVVVASLRGNVKIANIPSGMESPIPAERLMTPTADNRGGIGL
jgi:hypothetical protein